MTSTTLIKSVKLLYTNLLGRHQISPRSTDNYWQWQPAVWNKRFYQHNNIILIFEFLRTIKASNTQKRIFIKYFISTFIFTCKLEWYRMDASAMFKTIFSEYVSACITCNIMKKMIGYLGKQNWSIRCVRKVNAWPWSREVFFILVIGQEEW